MKKYLIVLCLVLVLTGCSATYEFSINNGVLKEKLNVIENNKALFDIQNDAGWTLREVFDSNIYYDEFSNEDYKIKEFSDEEHLEIEFSSNSFTTLSNSSILNQCYTSPYVEKSDNIITIETGNDFNCYEYYDNLESIEVIFKTNHEVILTNANEEKDGVYIWHLNKDSNKNIIISYDESIVHNKYQIVIIIGVVILIASVLVATYLIIKKSKKENMI